MMNANTTPVLSVDTLHKSYGERPIIKGVSLDIHAGETVALIGASGSGKSTLLRCMGLLEPFDEGVISLRGEEIARGGAAARRESKAMARKRANFGFVFQQFNLIHNRTAIENVMEGPVIVQKKPRAEAYEHARELMDRVGVGHRIDAAVPEMSGGEQQRVAIARALAMNPQCLLLDEPTSALDPELVSEVLDVVSQLSRDGVTMVIVTHEMGFAYEAADKVVFLSNGNVCEQGAAKQVFEDPQTKELRSFLRRFHYSALPVVPPPTAAFSVTQDGSPA